MTRVKTHIKPESLQKDLTIKDEEFKTVYFEEYPRKIIVPEQGYRPPQYDYLQYLRNVEEQLLVNPPAPIAFQLSEMKDSFRMNYRTPKFDECKAPCELARCYITKLGVEQQPAIPPHGKGFWKWTDPYLTVSKSTHIPFPLVNDKLNEKIITLYNESEFDLPPPSGNKTMFDKCTFKNMLPVRLLARSVKRVPHFGMHSEYQDHYVKQTFSYLHPYLEDRCTEFEDSLPEANRWQNLSPPGMYCTEYCNIGGPSVRCTVDIERIKKKARVDSENCCRI
ncbi:uncharacterized protein LOC135132252 isoform X2 [Zophobas morio]|uniref:uncharacterized protein LOC135132252 isoform X2 n=1 Tax=Zophobas morio TaxID=2755281 RepID=UPI0030829E99